MYLSTVADSLATPAVTTAARAPSAIDILQDRKLLEPEALERARSVAEEAGESVELALTRLGLVSEHDMALAFSEALGLAVVAGNELQLDRLPLDNFGPKFLRQFRVLPIGLTDMAVDLAMANPLDDYAVQAIELFTGRSVNRYVARATDLENALERLIGSESEPRAAEDVNAEVLDDDVDRLKDLASDAPVVRLVNQMIAHAVEARAADIHIEPGPDRLVVRYRIDGTMREVETPSLRLKDAISSRIKIMAKLNIAERRLPQDGRMSFSVRGAEVDLRVATVPTIHGESIVIRILDQANVALDFKILGFDAEALERHRQALAIPHGIVLVTGPTGSGKTTTLYASLAELNTRERKIMTIEDPVEYQLDGITQVQVQTQIGLTFARALRAFLRQNPNIVMVGEIRDTETAQIAVQAALTGHMILATLHTNDAATGVTRLLDMGIEDYLLASTVNAIVAQRLVRCLCRACREAYSESPVLLDKLDTAIGDPVTLYRPVGCEQCAGTGYKGRTTIIEILLMSDRIRRLVLDQAPASEIQRVAVAEGMRTMRAHGLSKALTGLTSIDEVLSATRSDDANLSIPGI